MNTRIVRLCAAALALLMLCGACSRKKTARDASPTGMTAEEIMALRNPVEPDMIVDGVAYVRKTGVQTVLFMGIDKKGDLETAANSLGGQSDVLILVVVDADARKQTMLQIDRDTMTEVEILDSRGNPTGIRRQQQICLSHTYGQGDEKSCENTVRTVSELLLGIPVDGYVALLYDAVPALNDAVGGVEVRITDDLTAADPSLIEGKTVTLNGSQALTFVRGRTNVADGTNVNRMGRQRTYLNALGSKVRAMMKTGSSVLNDLYYTAEPYMVTDMTLSELTSVAAEGAGYTDAGIVTVSGEHTREVYPNGNTYVEFHADGDSILENVLALFYEPIG